MIRERVDARAGATLALLCAIWALGNVATKIGLDGISANWQAGLRSVGAAVLLMVWMAWRGVPIIRRDGSLIAGLACGAMFTIEFALIFGGLHYTTASRAVLFLYTAPFFIAIGAHLALPGDRLTPRKLVGLACAFAGVGVAMGDGLSMPTGRELVGDAMCLLAAAAWGATTIVIRLSKLAYAPAETTLLYQLLVSALALIAFGVAIGEPGLFNPTPVVIGSLVFQIAIVAFASYLVWFWMVTRYPASRLAAWTFLTPAFGVLFGHLMLNDPVTPLLVASLALIAAGIYLVNRPTAAA